MRERLAANARYRAVLLTHNETSTGVMNPIPELAAAVRDTAPETLILVDSVSGLGAVPFAMDEWGIDVVVTGSQKAWMSAPGLAMVAASARAGRRWRRPACRASTSTSAATATPHAKGETPWTPAIAVVFQVDEGIRLMQAEGADDVFARHEACAAAARAGSRGARLRPLRRSPLRVEDRDAASGSPDGVDWKSINAEVKRRGVVLAGGQGKLAGKVFRVGHLGSVTVEEILGAVAVLEAVGIEQGQDVKPGAAVAAAQAAALQHPRDRASGRRDRMRILVAEPIAREGVELLRAHHDVDERPGLSRAELCAAIGEYDALVVRSQVKVDADLIAAGHRLVVIGRAGVGVDNVDLDAATHAGITVVNAPTGNTIAAAEHTLALLFSLARRIAAADASVRRGEWKRSEFTGTRAPRQDPGDRRAGQDRAGHRRPGAWTGDDDPGRRPVRDGRAGGPPRRRDDGPRRAPRAFGRGNRARADHPGDAWLDRARGAGPHEAGRAPPQRRPRRRGRRGGRGGGPARSAGSRAPAFDVFEQEPPTGSPLLDAPNTVLTPHLGASTEEAQVLVAEEVADQVLDVLAGRPARYAVNAPLLTPEMAKALAPYLPLAEILGRFFAQFSRAAVRTLTIEFAGDLAEFDGSPLTAAVLRGLLETATTERVNLVNAGALARARGITVVERKTPEAGAFAALLSLSGESEGRTTTVSGTVAFGEPRLARLDDYWLDMAPSDVMLITRHEDRPGTVGRIGLILGEADVNISAMHLARTRPREDAFMILALDDDVPPAVADAIRANEAVLDLWTIRLGVDR